MDTFVFACVLLAAACHAGWNALVKLKLEPLLAITLISIACGVILLPLIPFTPPPPVASWPYIAASLAIHMVYYLALGEAYRTGDLGQIYPIARGGAPLLTACLSTALLGEHLGPYGWLGVVLLALGVTALSLRGGRDLARFEGRAIGFALLTALSIAAYTVVDGTGARIAGAALPYIVWLIVTDAIMMLVFGLVRWRRTLIDEFMRAWKAMLLGGAMATASYGIAIWAMTKAPIALVAALRETSVLFAALIGVVALREPLLPMRMVAGALVLAGIVMLRLR